MASKREDLVLWWIFFILGMGTLLPWNFFITPYQYWIDKLDTTNITSENGTDGGYNTYQQFWASSLGVTTMLTNFLMCFATTMCMNIIPRNTRFYVPMAGIAVCFAIAAAMSQIDSSAWVPTFFITTMINVIIITVFCAIFQASLFGHAAEVGEVTPAVMAGQGAGGVFACVVDVISKLVLGDDLTTAVCMYFIIAVIFMFISAAAYKYMQPMAIYQHRLDKSSPVNDEVKLEPNEDEKLMDNDMKEEVTVMGAIKNGCWPYFVTLVLTFALTLGVFPAVVVTYKSVNHDETSDYYTKFFTTIWIFLNFNVFDFVGRYLAGLASQEGHVLNIIKKDQPILLMVAAGARFIFMPLFMKCHITKTTGTVSAFLNYDSVFIVLMALMSFSNGFVSSLAMIYGPQAAPEKVRGQIGGYLGTTLVFGLLSGALLSIVAVPFGQTF